MKIKYKIQLIVLFLLINTSVYFLTQYNTNNIIKQELKDNLKILKIHYDIILTSQKNISYAIYKSILRNTDAIQILSESYVQNKEQQNQNRIKLLEQLKEQYETAKKQGILQIQFVNKNNISFLRVHKPSKFGDDLSFIREDYKYVSKTHKAIRGFVQGKVAHGFRNTFPIFDKNNKYIGAVEISFSSDRFQWYLNNISKIHTHFLVNKKIFHSKVWDRDDKIIKYNTSLESDNFMRIVEGNNIDSNIIGDNKNKLQSIKNIINNKMNLKKQFALYTDYNNKTEVVSFVPILDFNKDVSAWLVSYEESLIIKNTLENMNLFRIINLILSFMIIYFLRKQIISNATINEQHTLLNEILDSTQNILFITNFKNIKFSNNKFKELFNVLDSKSYNELTQHDALDMFIQEEGYLHKGLLEDGDSFINLLASTSEKDRIVLIRDKYLNEKAFSITASKLKQNDDFLITLTDITKLNEELNQIKNKVYTDGLTKVYNRNKFDEVLTEEIKRVKRYKKPLSIAIIDIDKFKDFNDKFGHLIGDEVLISMAQTVNINLRETDTFARWGGEEFVILFDNTSVEIAKNVSLKLKDKIEENIHPVAGKITASFGLTQYKENDTIKSMFKRCDDALYIAKKNGRNRVEIL